MKITIPEAAKITGIHKTTIRTAILRGSIYAEKIGRDWFISYNSLVIWRAAIGRPLKEKDRLA